MNFWLTGNAVFMRGWTGQYPGIVNSPTAVHDKTSVAAMPGGVGGQRGTMGGSGTGISKYSAHQEEALQLLRAISSEQTGRERAEAGAYIPARIALRDDPRLMSRTSLKGTVARQVIQNMVARPSLQAGNSYNRVSRAYYNAVHSVLARRVAPAAALTRLEADLVSITGFSPAH